MKWCNKEMYDWDLLEEYEYIHEVKKTFHTSSIQCNIIKEDDEDEWNFIKEYNILNKKDIISLEKFLLKEVEKLCDFIFPDEKKSRIRDIKKIIYINYKDKLISPVKENKITEYQIDKQLWTLIDNPKEIYNTIYKDIKFKD